MRIFVSIILSLSILLTGSVTASVDRCDTASMAAEDNDCCSALPDCCSTPLESNEIESGCCGCDCQISVHLPLIPFIAKDFTAPLLLPETLAALEAALLLRSDSPPSPPPKYS